MKLAISNIAWTKEEDAAVAEVMRALGCTGLEIAPTRIWERPTEVAGADLYAFRAQWSALGVEIVALQALLFGRPELVLFGEAFARAAMLEYLKHIIHLAARLGAKALVFGSPKNRHRGAMETTAAMAIASEFFRQVAEAAQAAGVFFCIEPNAKEYGCDFVTNTSEACALLREVAHPGLGLHLDAGILTINGEEPEAALQIAQPYLRHFHISEPYLAQVGSGAVDHARMSAALRGTGYSGWLSIEMKAGAGPDNVASVRAALTAAQRAYLGKSA